jgi:hypothetical protein
MTPAAASLARIVREDAAQFELNACRRAPAPMNVHSLPYTLAGSNVRSAARQLFPAAHAEEAEALAAELRRQAHRCESPVNAERDAERSRPDETVWVVRCTNATYRMRLIPHQAAHVEQI